MSPDFPCQKPAHKRAPYAIRVAARHSIPPNYLSEIFSINQKTAETEDRELEEPK